MTQKSRILEEEKIIQDIKESRQQGHKDTKKDTRCKGKDTRAAGTMLLLTALASIFDCPRHSL